MIDATKWLVEVLCAPCGAELRGKPVHAGAAPATVSGE